MVDGCSRSFHQPAGNASGSLAVTPYLEFLPWVKVGFGNVLYGRATCSIKPTVYFVATFDTAVSTNVSIAVNVTIPIIFTFVAGYNVNIVIISRSDEQTFGPFQIANPSWSYNMVIDLLAVVQTLHHGPSVKSVASQAHLLALPTPSSSSCACDTPYITIPFVDSTATASVATSTATWAVVNGTAIDTCDYVSVPVDATTMLFTAPVTSNYNIQATLLAVSPQSQSNSWNLMARIGVLCCGGVIFCAEISATTPTWSYSDFFLQQNDTLSLVWSSSSAGSVANISVVITQNQNPTVYVDASGSDSDDGSFSSPVATLQRGLNVLATLVTAKATAATLVFGPTVYTSSITSPTLPSGFQIPDILRTVPLTIQSQVSLKATSIFDAWTEQSYCNYNTQQCTTRDAFQDSVYGTSFDTEIHGCVLLFQRSDVRTFNFHSCHTASGTTSTPRQGAC